MQQLPVAAQRVYTEHWIREVPYANVPRFDVELPPNISKELFGLLTGYVIKELQDSADRNVVRTLLHNLSIENNRDNDTFLKILQGATEYASMILSRSSSPEYAIRDAAILTVAVAAATILNTHPHMRQFLSEAQLSEFNKYLVMGSQIQQEVKAHMNHYMNHPGYQQQQPQYSYAVNPDGTPAVMSDGSQAIVDQFGNVFHYSQIGAEPRYLNPNPISHAFNMQPLSVSPPVPHNHSQIVNKHWSTRPSPQQNQMPGITNSSWRSPAARQQVNNNVPQHQTNRPFAEEEWDSDYGYSKPEPRQNNGTQVHRPQVTGGRTPTEASVHRSGRNRNISVSGQKNAKVIEALNSPHKWMHTEDQPWPLAYDPITTKLMHVVHENGIVTHSIEGRSKEANLDYLQHELRPDLRAAYRREQEKAQRKISSNENALAPLESSRGLDEIVETNKDTLADTVDAQLLVNETIFISGNERGEIECSSVADGISKCEQQLREKDISPKSAFTFNAKIKTEMAVSENDQEMLSTLKVSGRSSFASVISIMDSYASGDSSPSRFWHAMNEKLTKVVNDTLIYGLGLTIDITSFMLDGNILDAHIRDKINPKIADIFKDQVEDILHKVFDTVVIREDEGSVFKAVFTDTVLTVVIPATAMELRINFDKDDYGLVLPSNFPVLHRVLSRIIANMPTATRAVIVTGDNVTLKIYRGLLNKDAILLGL